MAKSKGARGAGKSAGKAPPVRSGRVGQLDQRPIIDLDDDKPLGQLEQLPIIDLDDDDKPRELTKANSRIKLAKGDLWDWFDKGHRIVVTTNIGWHPTTGRNNMGAGMALQAALRFPGLERDIAGGPQPRVKAEDRAGYRSVFPEGLDVWYGSLCEQLGEETPVVSYAAERRIILFPVKPLLDTTNPERSWDQEASYTLIAKSLHQLRTFEGKIALSYPGAGNGHLDEKKVGIIVERILGQDPNPERFTLVTFKPKQTGLSLRKLGGDPTPLDDLFLDTRYAPR